MLALLASGPNVILCHVSPSFAKSRALNSYPLIRVMLWSPLTAMSLHLTATSSFLLTYFAWLLLRHLVFSSLTITLKWRGNAPSFNLVQAFHICDTTSCSLLLNQIFSFPCLLSVLWWAPGSQLHIPWLLTPKRDKNTWVLALSWPRTLRNREAGNLYEYLRTRSILQRHTNKF